jgi:GMP synthase PP-ATPase subunit
MSLTDGMMAEFYPSDMKFLGQVATRIVNEVNGREPRGVRRDEHAAGDDRVGVR